MQRWMLYVLDCAWCLRLLKISPCLPDLAWHGFVLYSVWVYTAYQFQCKILKYESSVAINHRREILSGDSIVYYLVEHRERRKKTRSTLSISINHLARIFRILLAAFFFLLISSIAANSLNYAEAGSLAGKLWPMKKKTARIIQIVAACIEHLFLCAGTLSSTFSIWGDRHNENRCSHIRAHCNCRVRAMNEHPYLVRFEWSHAWIFVIGAVHFLFALSLSIYSPTIGGHIFSMEANKLIFVSAKALPSNAFASQVQYQLSSTLRFVDSMNSCNALISIWSGTKKHAHSNRKSKSFFQCFFFHSFFLCWCNVLDEHIQTNFFLLSLMLFPIQWYLIMLV